MTALPLRMPPGLGRFVRLSTELAEQRRQWVYVWAGVIFPPLVMAFGLFSGLKYGWTGPVMLWGLIGILQFLLCVPMALRGWVHYTMPLMCGLILVACTIAERLQPDSYGAVGGLATVIGLVSLTESSRRILWAGAICVVCSVIPILCAPAHRALPIGLDLNSRVSVLIVITGLAYVGARVSTKALNDLRDNIADNEAMATILHENLANLEAAVHDRTRSLAVRTAELETINADLDEAIRGEAALADQLRRQSLHDELTGLVNRRGFMNTLNEVEEHGGWIVMADMDHFKSINDTWGHPAGDETLVYFAECLRRATPEGGLAARVGGEEFAIVLPAPCLPATVDAGAEGSREFVIDFCEHLLAEVRYLRVPTLRGRQVTVSLGAAQFEAGSAGSHGVEEESDGFLAGLDTPSSVTHRRRGMSALRRADSALYQAKAAGRDRAVVAQTSARAS